MNDYSDNDYWKALAERFFEAGTSEEEERELRRFIDNPLTESQLRAAKKQLLGQIGISTDAPEAYSLALGKTFAHYNRYRDIAALCDSIAQVTARSVQEVAAEVYAEERLTTLVYR